MLWDPSQYARYGSERNRPFFDLLGQVAADTPGSVVDLGCGSGELTAALAQRWPGAMIRGLDSSAEMIERSSAYSSDRVTFGLAEAADFAASGVDVLISNALLQWVPDHGSLLTRWASELNPGGWLAFSVPDNFHSPSHVLMRELAESARWAPMLTGVLRHLDAVSPAADYLALLNSTGLRTSAWQTRYLHVLAGPDPVLEWVRGTGLRPVLATLSTADAAEYQASYGALLHEAYPERDFGTVFPFLRTFVVAHKATGGQP